MRNDYLIKKYNLNKSDVGILEEFNELMASDYSVGMYGMEIDEAKKELLKSLEPKYKKSILKIARILSKEQDEEIKAEREYYGR